MVISGLAVMKSAKIDFMAGPLASSGPQLCQMFKVTVALVAAAGGWVAVGAGACVAGAWVAGAAVGALPQAVKIMDVIARSASSVKNIFLFILSLFLSSRLLNGEKAKTDGSEYEISVAALSSLPVKHVKLWLLFYIHYFGASFPDHFQGKWNI
jgi:hypothetical protein